MGPNELAHNGEADAGSSAPASAGVLAGRRLYGEPMRGGGICLRILNRVTCGNAPDQHTPVLGLVENMAYFIAPQGEYCEILGPTHSSELESVASAPLLARLPLDPELALLCDAGHIEKYSAESATTLATNFLQTLQARGQTRVRS